MARDWLLVETLGEEPAVVALGRQLKNLVPISAFLRRNPHLAAIRTAIAESVQTGESLVSITPKSDRVIRTEPVLMSDGRMHGVHVWSGPAAEEPPERPMPGALKWDMSHAVSTVTPQSLVNAGKDPAVEETHGRSFADDWPARDLQPNESKILALAVKPEPGQTLLGTWDTSDGDGHPIRVGYVVRNALEPGPDGRDHLIGRGMNWRAEPVASAEPTDGLAERILHGLAQPGVHRALADLNSWNLLKWLDEPCPFYDWRRSMRSPRVYPDDEPLLKAMTEEFATGPSARVLRLPGYDGTWVPVHVTINRVELEEQMCAGLVSVRLPTNAELADAGLLEPDTQGASRGRGDTPLPA